MSRQRKAMWLFAIIGWLIIMFPASGAELLRVITGCGLLLASCLLSLKRIKP